MLQVKQSTAVAHFVFLMVDSTDHVTGKTGLTPTVTLSKNGAAFASPAGAITEISGGWYKLAANATDANTLGVLALHATGTAADPTDMILANIVAYDPQDAVRAGLTALPNAAAGATGGLPTVDANNSVKIQSGIKKNQAIPGFQFLMTDSTNHNPATGKTVTATRSIDGAAQASGTLGAVTEVANGTYKLDIGAGDLNGGNIMLRFTASGCDDLFLTFVTEP